MKFTELNLNSNTIKGLKEMGFEEMMPIQEKAIPEILKGKDIVGQAQTGTGKTAAFGIPMFENIEAYKINHLIIAPTRELAMQIVNELRKIGMYHKNITIAALVGGMNIKAQQDTLKKNPEIVVGTPGRLNDLIKRKKLSLNGIKMLVIDEVDEMYKAGFKEEIDEIVKFLPKTVQTLLFSATISKNVENIAKASMDNRVNIYVSEGQSSTENIIQECIIVKEKDKFETLVKLLEIDKPNLAVIFGRTKRRADELGEALNQSGYKALALHGDLSQQQRNNVMRKFRNNEINILVATDVAARGIDVTGITHVYNFDLPQETEFYTHRIGRTGRAGKTGKAISLIRDSEVSHVEKIKRDTKSIINIVSAPSKKEVGELKRSKLEQKIEEEIKKVDITKNEEFIKKLSEKYYFVSF